MSVEISVDIEGIEKFKEAMTRFDSGIQKQVHWQLARWAADVKASAKRIVPVRTGHLRNSIYSKIEDWVTQIGADATYAFFVEFGTRFMQARPYLYPAIQEHLPRLEAIISEAIGVAKQEAGL